MLLGKILVTIGAIEESQLDHMLRLKLEESVYEIFTWPSGDFRFLDEDLDEEGGFSSEEVLEEIEA